MEKIFEQVDKDLNDFTYYNNILERLEVASKIDFNLDHYIIKIEIKNNIAKIIHNAKATRRAEGIIKIVNMALEYGKVDDTKIYLHVADDFIFRFSELPFFIIAKPLNKKGILMVDNTFVDTQPEVKTNVDKSKMESWDETNDMIIKKCNNIKKENKIFFIGQNIALKKTDFNIREYFSKIKKTYPLDVRVSGYMHMSEFCKFKYLLNLPGMSPWSFRFKFLFLMKSFIINIALYRNYSKKSDKYDDKWINIFDRLFIPNEDYIELKYYYDREIDQNENLKKLENEIKDIYLKYEKDDELYNKIVNNGYEKGKLITTENIKKVAHYIISNYAKKVKNKNKISENLKSKIDIINQIKEINNQYYKINKHEKINNITYKKIGQGTQGDVYLFTFNKIEWIVKILYLRFTFYEPYREIYFGDIINEINKNHEFLYYYDYKIIDNFIYISMENADQDLIKWSSNKQSINEWKCMILQIINQLFILQSASITHCDLQAKNIVCKDKKTTIKFTINNKQMEYECNNKFYIIDFGISAHPELNINIISKIELNNKNFDIKKFSNISNGLKSINVKNKYSYNELINKINKIRESEKLPEFIIKLFEYFNKKLLNLVNKIIKINTTKYLNMIDELKLFIENIDIENIHELVNIIRTKITLIYIMFENDFKDNDNLITQINMHKIRILHLYDNRTNSLFFEKNKHMIKIISTFEKTKKWFKNKNDQLDYVHYKLAYYYVKSGYFSNDDYMIGCPQKLPKEIEYMFNSLNLLYKNNGKLKDWVLLNYTNM